MPAPSCRAGIGFLGGHDLARPVDRFVARPCGESQAIAERHRACDKSEAQARSSIVASSDAPPRPMRKGRMSNSGTASPLLVSARDALEYFEPTRRCAPPEAPQPAADKPARTGPHRSERDRQTSQRDGIAASGHRSLFGSTDAEITGPRSTRSAPPRSGGRNDRGLEGSPRGPRTQATANPWSASQSDWENVSKSLAVQQVLSGLCPTVTPMTDTSVATQALVRDSDALHRPDRRRRGLVGYARSRPPASCSATRPAR